MPIIINLLALFHGQSAISIYFAENLAVFGLWVIIVKIVYELLDSYRICGNFISVLYKAAHICE